MKLQEIEQLVAILKNSDVTELELERQGVHIRLTRGGHRTPVSTSEVHLPSQVVEPAIVSVANNGTNGARVHEAVADHLVKVESPIVGTFYRRPSPDTVPFVGEGDRVKKGATLCIVEAMKLMNEIESPCDGKIEKILLTDGKVVEFGETLFLINPAA